MRVTPTLKAAGAALALAALAAPALAQSSSVLVTEVFRRFEAENTNLRKVSEHHASLPQGEGDGFQFQARAGTEYLVIGVCDENCTDIDLQAADTANTPVAQDILPDDIPVLRFTAAESGTYTIVMLMSACEAASCQMGVKVYQ